MTPRAFYDLTRSLRFAQRSLSVADNDVDKAHWQAECKELEKRVDDEISRVDAILKRNETKARLDDKVKMMESKGFVVVEYTKQ